MRSQVVIDARWLHTGVGTYTLNLLAGLRPYSGGLAVRAIARREDARVIAPLVDEVTFVDVPIYTLREQVEIPRAARGADLLHVPHYNAPLPYRGALLVTILDLIHIMDPTHRRSLGSWMYARPMLYWVARKACHVITLSEYSKTQIVERLRVPASKVTVISCGVSSHFRAPDTAEISLKVRAALSLERPYLLYVGNLKPHKNVISLLRAFALLCGRRALDHQLVVVGDDAKWKRGLIEECSRLGVQERVSFIPHVSHELLPQVYAGADLLVVPSYLEGFGLPVLEAMACGTPVVCSRAASLPEVAGEAAEFFDPCSVEDLAATIERVLESSHLRAALRRKGLEQASRFSWDECARRHSQIYRELLQN